MAVAAMREGDTTLEKYIEFYSQPENEGKRIELIDGYIVMMAGNTSLNHIRICGHIARAIGNYLAGKKCEVFQDANVRLFEEDIGKCRNSFQPDIIIGCDRSKMGVMAYEGTPEFVAEVVSKTSRSYDYMVKCAVYMEYGVREYWIVDMLKEQVLVYLNGGDGSYDMKRYTFDDTVTVTVLDGLQIDFSEIKEVIRP